MSALEDTLEFQLRAVGITAEREYRFHDGRKWLLDFAIPEYKIGIEVQGGNWVHGAHSRGSGLARDYDKINAAQLSGWCVLQFDTNMVSDGRALSTIQQALEKCQQGEI